MKKFTRSAIVALVLLSSCSPDDDGPVPVSGVLDLSSQYYFDINAQPTGQSAPAEDFQQETWQQ